MFLGAIFLLCLVSVKLAGGRLTALADVRFRGAWLIVAAIVAQVLIISVLPGGDSWIHQAVHLGTYALAGAFVVVNRRIPGLLLAGAGGAMNFAAIAANGGVMPAHPRALEIAGIVHEGGTFENSAAVEGANLQLLGDIFAVPGINVFSAGDVVLVIGILVGLHTICRAAPVALRSFELVAATRSHALLRVWADVPRGHAVAALHIEAAGRRQRLDPLPAAAGAPVQSFPLPAALADGDPEFALELSTGERLELPAPTRRGLGRPSMPTVA